MEQQQQQHMKTVIQIIVIVLHFRGSSADMRWERSVLVGEDVTLRCLFGSQSTLVEKAALTVEWNVVDKHARKSVVYTFDGRVQENTDGYTVDELGLLQNNASLQLRNVTLRDEGLYTCRIITPVVHIETTSLEVLAQPSVSLPEEASITEGEEKSLQCDIAGFYPKELAVKWLIQRGSSSALTDVRSRSRVCTEIPIPNQNGTYSTRSGITLRSLTARDGGIRVVCQVEHRSYKQPHSTSVALTVRAPSQPYSAVTLVAVTSVIILLLVTMVTAVTLLLYRYFCKAPPSVSQISQASVIHAQVPTGLTCTIQGATERELKVKWLKLMTSTDSAAPSGAAAPLLVSEDVSGSASLRSDGEHHTSVLTVCLTVADDLSKYRCEVMWRGGSIMRETTVRVKVKPSFLQISSIPQIPKVEKLLVLCCRVENFYPQDVYLEWSRNDGEEVRTVTHFGPFSGQNRLCSVWSKIQLIMAREDERAVYTCRVYHSSFPAPGYEDILYHINTQGSPPEVLFIECEPRCPLNEECTLHLCIKDFCPEDVSVTWTKDGQTIHSGVFNTPPSLNINGLYSMFSFLKLPPNTDDRGSEFTCRVVHSAQREPEERHFTLPNLHPTNVLSVFACRGQSSPTRLLRALDRPTQRQTETDNHSDRPTGNELDTHV